MPKVQGMQANTSQVSQGVEQVCTRKGNNNDPYGNVWCDWDQQVQKSTRSNYQDSRLKGHKEQRLKVKVQGSRLRSKEKLQR